MALAGGLLFFIAALAGFGFISHGEVQDDALSSLCSTLYNYAETL